MLDYRSTAQRSERVLQVRVPLGYREQFYHAACAAIALATRDCKSKRERRTAEREAILATLERFGVITRTWGSGASRRIKCERIA